jgi:hypothetical protein
MFGFICQALTVIVSVLRDGGEALKVILALLFFLTYLTAYKRSVVGINDE